jgi:hypothetical protein
VSADIFEKKRVRALVIGRARQAWYLQGKFTFSGKTNRDQKANILLLK